MNETFNEFKDLKIKLHNEQYINNKTRKEIDELNKKIEKLNEEVVYWIKSYQEEVRKQGRK